MVETEAPLALVTGAAHRLGRAFAISLARLGYAVLLHYNSSGKQAAKTIEEIESLGVLAYSFKADLTDISQIDSLFSYLDTLPHTLTVVVNSAAVMPRGDIRSLSAEAWDSTMALNLKAPFFIAQRAAARMKKNGLIVNIIDAGVGKTWTGFPAYIVSKSALQTLTRLLAKALAPAIRVNAIAPGLVLPAESISSQEWEKLIDRLPLKRSTNPEEVSSTLEFIVNNPSLTGQTIYIDGGYSLT